MTTSGRYYLSPIIQKSDCVDCAEAGTRFKRILVDMPNDLKEMLGLDMDQDELVAICPGCLRRKLGSLTTKIHLKKYAQ